MHVDFSNADEFGRKTAISLLLRIRETKYRSLANPPSPPLPPPPQLLNRKEEEKSGLVQTP